MKTFDVGAIAELALYKLQNEGALSASNFSLYKTIGFRTILKHFESIGNLCVDNDVLRRFIEGQYDIYKNDKKLAWRWERIRRSTELLMYFASTGRIDMPPLPRWTKRDCQLYIEPSREQLADNDNIYGLVWRTRKAIKEFGYADNTITYYDSSGFSKILAVYKNARTEVYSRKLNAKLVLDAQKFVQAGKLKRCQALRKAAALLDEFHRYGMLTLARLSPFHTLSLNSEFETLVEEYGNDTLLSGKLSTVTAATARSIIKGFLLDLERSGFSSFKGVTLSLVSDVIVRRAANHYKRGADSLLHYVRDFLKYLYEYGLIKNDLSVAVPKIAAPIRKVYQGFNDGEIRKLLAAVDHSTLIGKRDYAIMTLAAQTGLRAIDVVNLKRSDIDWRKREIHISQSKTGEPLCLTLEIESGNAIYDYLLTARQKCDIQNIFLCAAYPLKALCRMGMQSIVLKYMKIAGIKSAAHQRYGFHSFRRAFGTRLLENGTPIHLLSQLLGHRNIDSVKPYISTSEQGLKECCLSLILNECGGDTQ
jgi:site-specific recombinase XerD